MSGNHFSCQEFLLCLIFWIGLSGFGVLGYNQFLTDPFILITGSIALCPAVISAIVFFGIKIVLFFKFAGELTIFLLTPSLILKHLKLVEMSRKRWMLRKLLH